MPRGIHPIRRQLGDDAVAHRVFLRHRDDFFGAQTGAFDGERLLDRHLDALSEVGPELTVGLGLLEHTRDPIFYGHES
jgi:hypothetical protein